MRLDLQTIEFKKETSNCASCPGTAVSVLYKVCIGFLENHLGYGKWVGSGFKIIPGTKSKIMSIRVEWHKYGKRKPD